MDVINKPATAFIFSSHSLKYFSHTTSYIPQSSLHHSLVPMANDHMAKPKPGLEELYQGIPDESVNLTFQDLANVISSHHTDTTMPATQHVSEPNNNPTKGPSPSPSLSTVPSLDFRKGLEGLNRNNHHYQLHGFGHGGGDSSWGHFNHASGSAARAQISRPSEYSMSYDGIKSGESFASGKGGSGRRRRPGIPHSTICTICSNYVYLFRTRCLVCLCTDIY